MTVESDSLLLALADYVLNATKNLPDYQSDDVLPTAKDLAKQLGVKPEKIKGRLTKLRMMGLIQVIGANPKRFKFDCYELERLKEDHPLFEHFFAS